MRRRTAAPPGAGPAVGPAVEAVVGTTPVSDADLDLEEIELTLLLEGIFQRYGFDFRGYARASLRRRVWHSVRSEGLETISAFQDRVLHDRACMERFILAMSINVTGMFRDPSFYLTFRRKVVPLLHGLPFVRVWLAGCSTGEEVYSTAIVLREEGLDGRCRLYATDVNEAVVARAREGIFPLAAMQEYTRAYQEAGGRASFSEYYYARYESAILDATLRRNVVFAQHNLATDASFNEFHVVFCRNVMIYFGDTLRDRVHRLIYESLPVGGVLGLGNKESVRFTPLEERYEALDSRDRLYRKVR